MKDFSYITNSHPSYIEHLYNDFVANPESVDPEMRKFFEGFDFAFSKVVTSSTNGTSQNGTSAKDQLANEIGLDAHKVDIQTVQKELSVYQLIQAYRKKGHLVAKTNPIRERKDRRANLQLSNFGLSDADLNTTFEAGKFIGLSSATLKDIVSHLQMSYTASVCHTKYYLLYIKVCCRIYNGIKSCNCSFTSFK